MRRDADREERNARLLAGVVLAAMLVLLSGIIHLLYHREYAETDTPNDCFAVSAATGETALPKIVCLTFDDGPSKNTRPILEILDKEQVPATFFVCAQDANEKYLPLVADIAAAGHQIALHSATHQYSKIYAGTDAFWQDIRTLRQALEPYVDVAAIDWLRFPGGSTNTVSHRYGGNGIMKTLKAKAEDKGYHWIDWNVCAEDATASHPDAAQILRNIRRDADGQDTCVVLLHDTKATGQTVKALPDMIAYFREQGYTFCTVAQMDALQSETKWGIMYKNQKAVGGGTMRKTESQKIALCGMLGALSVVLLLLGSALQIGTYAAPMLAAFLLIPVLEEYGTRYALTLYVCVAILAVLFVPETELALFYVLVMGYYPVLRVKLNGVKSTLLRWVLKFAVFNAGTVLVYLLLFALLGPAVLDELLADGTGMLAALLAAGNLSFWLCDRALAALTRYYHVILKPKLKKKF